MLGTCKGRRLDCVHMRYRLAGWLDIRGETQSDGGAHGGMVLNGGRRVVVGVCRHPWGGRRLWAGTACDGLPRTSPTGSPKRPTPCGTKGMFTIGVDAVTFE